MGFCGVEAFGIFKDDSVLSFDVDVADGLGISSALVLRVFICDDVGAFFSAACVSGCHVGAIGGETASAFVVGVGVGPCWEGSAGLGSGGCALSDSVTASAAARSAARDASCGVVGGAGGACDGAVGFADLTGSMIKLVSHSSPVTNIMKTYSQRIVLMQLRSGSTGST